MVRKAISTQSEGCCTYAIGLQPLSMLFIIPTNKALRSTLLKPHLLPTAPVYRIATKANPSLLPCGKLLPLPTHPYALIAVFTAHCTAERKFSLGVDCPKVQSNLTEAFLPYILASLKCTLLDKVKTHFPFVCSLTVHIAIREKGGFRSRNAGRSGGLFRQKKGKYPF